jgi:tetratricopeptide (TPR) repeat protein
MYVSMAIELSLSSDGRRLASFGPDDQAVRIWDVATRQELYSFRIDTGRIKSVDLSPDGTRLAVGTSASQVLVWDARPLTDEIRAELNDVSRVETLFADNLVESLFYEHLLSADLIEAIQADTTLSESLRNKAIDRARYMPVDPNQLIQLNNRSWSAVSQPGLSADQYQLALRLAEEACKPGPDHPSYHLFLRTLGVAQYRVGKYAEAVGTLTQSDELCSKRPDGSLPSNIAVLAMAHFQLGHVDQARTLLERLRQLLQSERWKTNTGSQRYLEEAEQLILEAPVEAEVGLGGSQPWKTTIASG